MWTLGVSAVVCNGVVFYIRWSETKSSIVQSLLISHLSLSDGLMGVNMLLLASAEAYYAYFSPSFARHVAIWTFVQSCWRLVNSLK